ncbi:Rieske (2Fe-2S) protein [Streptomyces sp. NPDC020875]|uniref:QcrA and Rieske domain-containing protein n=1 Tax=Streptomyces sp. NPDC020875 TaxID=3154898 RepID=UPI0033DE3DD0
MSLTAPPPSGPGAGGDPPAHGGPPGDGGHQGPGPHGPESGDPEFHGSGGPGGAREALRDRIAADALTTRRDYLRIVTIVSGGLALGGIGVAAGILHRPNDVEGTPDPRKIADSLAPGEALAFTYPGKDDRAVAVRLADGTLVGYSAVCTHLACAVLYRADRGQEGELLCPCHDGVFDVRTGEVTAGPPPRPLPRVIVTEDLDGSIWALATTRSGESDKDAWCRQFAEVSPDQAVELGCPGAELPKDDV